MNLSNFSNLQNLNVSNNNITTLNVNGCTSLFSANVNNNTLASLDVSTCTSLEILYLDNNNLQGNLSGLSNMSTSLVGSKIVSIRNNNMTAQHLNAVFNQLPTKPSGANFEWSIYVNNNAGTCACDWTIVKNKGWYIYPIRSNLTATKLNSTVTFNLQHSVSTATVGYTITGVSSSEINGASLTGNFNVSNHSASLTLTITTTTTGTKNLVLTINGATCATSKTITITTTSSTSTSCNYSNYCTCCDTNNMDGCPSSNSGDPCHSGNVCFWVCGSCPGGTQFCHGTNVTTTTYSRTITV